MERSKVEIERYGNTVLGRAYLKSEFNIAGLANKTGCITAETIRRYLNTNSLPNSEYSINKIAIICEALDIDIKDIIAEAIYDYL